MKDIIATLVIMLLCITALAQQSASDSTIIPPTPKAKKATPGKLQEQPAAKDAHVSRFVSPVSLQIITGSQGIGADFKYGFLPKLSGRLGFAIIPVNASRGFGFSSFPVQGQFSTRFSNLHLLADYSPFKNQNFCIVGGASYLVQGNANVIITPANGYTIGSQSLNKDQLGALHANVTWKGVSPYLGFALFRGFPNRLFNVNLDIGTYYLSSPSTSFTGTKLLSNNDDNAKIFNKNMQGYHWLPVAQLNFNFRIK